MFEIKFRTCVKIGIGFYIGHAVAKSIDKSLGKAICDTEWYKHIKEKNVKREEQ